MTNQSYTISMDTRYFQTQFSIRPIVQFQKYHRFSISHLVKKNDSVNTEKISPPITIYISQKGTDHQATSITAKYRPMKIHKSASIIIIILERKHIRVNIHLPNIHQGQNINQVV